MENINYTTIVKNAVREIETSVKNGWGIEAAKWAVDMVARMKSINAEPVDTNKLWYDAKNYYFNVK